MGAQFDEKTMNSINQDYSVDMEGIYFDDEIDTSNFMKDFEKDLGMQSEYISNTTDFVNGLTLAWKDVNVTLPESTSGCLPFRKKTVPSKTIIKSASGIVRPGSVCAILGGSGSGKTSLLNAITRRDLGPLQVKGQILLNGQELREDINYFSGYVQQEDVFPGTLTVREHLWFTAKLRMGLNFTDDVRELRIQQVMKELGLKKCENTIIGTPGAKKGLSGGEKKRLAFASELLRNPMLLFADEPTSGLDAFSAQTVVKALINLASRGRTILCTIHQPSSNAYNLFPNVMYLTEGDVAYFGPNKSLLDFFNTAGFPCPKGFNPADFAIKTLAIVPGKEEASRSRNKDIVSFYDQTSQKSKMIQKIEGEILRGMDASGPLSFVMSDGGKQRIGTFSSTFLDQLYWLFWRYFLPYRRSVAKWGNCIVLVLFALIFGLLYFQQPYNQLGLANINSSIFIVSIQICFLTGLSVATDIGSDLANYRKEMKSKTYSVTAYYLAKTLSAAPSLLVGGVLYATIVYWMEGLYPDFGTYVIFVMTILMLTFVMAAIGHFAAAVAKTGEGAATIVPSIIGLSLVFSGALLRESSLLSFLQWLTYISPYNYAYVAVIINQWRNVEYIDCGPFNTDTNDVGCFTNGLEVLNSLNYDPGFLVFCFIYGCLILLLLELLSYFIFWRKSKKL